MSWYPPGKRDANGPEVDGLVMAVLEAAAARGVAVCLHLEPWPGRTAADVLGDVAYAVSAYGSHPAYHRIDGRPAFFAYDSYQLPAAEWRRARAAPDAPAAFLIALVLEPRHLDDYVGGGGFDGAYSYFGAAGFTRCSVLGAWAGLVAAAKARGGVFVPCVAPGYDDTRVRPWNAENSRDRDDGRYYERAWAAAIASGAERIAVTSFNEWHEGTQIEAAVKAAPTRPGVPPYADYGDRGPDAYLAQTATNVAAFAAARGPF